MVEATILTVNLLYKSYTKKLILKDTFQVSGSDTSAIGWVEVTGEEGQNGYLWYMKAEGDTRARFTDTVKCLC
jgi:hypothetical protein